MTTLQKNTTRRQGEIDLDADLAELLGVLYQPLRHTMFLSVSPVNAPRHVASLNMLREDLDRTWAATKGELPLIKLATFGKVRTDRGCVRHDANMLEITGIEGDYDGGSVSPREAVRLLAKAGVAALVYTSPSHRPEKPRWRVLVPLSKGHPPEERDRLCARLNGALGGILGNESFARSQSFYFGRVKGAPFEAFKVDGEPLDLVEGLPEIGKADPVSDDEGDEALRESAGPVDWERVDSALGWLDPACGYFAWRDVGMALHHGSGGGEDGFRRFNEWSARATGKNEKGKLIYPGERKLRSMWGSLGKPRQGRPDITLGTLYRMAQLEGWDPHTVPPDVFDDLDDGGEVQASAVVEVDLGDLSDIFAPSTPAMKAMSTVIAETEGERKAGGGDAGTLDLTDIFSPAIAGSQVPAPVATPRTSFVESIKAVGGMLDRTKGGKTLETLHNLSLILQHDFRLADCIRFNELEQLPVVVAPPRQAPPNKNGGERVNLIGPHWRIPRAGGQRWSDVHTTDVRTLLSASISAGGYGLNFSAPYVDSAIDALARRNSFHPIRAYLESVHSDWLRLRPARRVPRLFIDYLGCPDDRYHRRVALLTMVGAVARVYQPGMKFDFMPILEGEQGKGKSTFIRILAKDWGSETSPEFGDTKALVDSITGKWIIEVGELDAFGRVDEKRLKAAVSRTVDRTRLSYGRRSHDFPRQCIFIGTTNEGDYLHDPTGGRRYWPVRGELAGGIDTERLAGAVDLLWGEAVAVYQRLVALRAAAGKRGDLPLFMKGEAARQASVIQESRRADTSEDILAGKIAAKLAAPESSEPDGLGGVEVLRTVTCIPEVWALLGRDAEDLEKPGNARKVGAALRAIGWEPIGSRRFEGYGSQKAFEAPDRWHAKWGGEDGEKSILAQ